MDVKVDKERSMLEMLYAQIINDMKNSFPLWEDFLSKGSKLQMALKTTLTCLNAFLDSFQKVADMASGTRGSTKEISSALTRLCLRQRSVENKTKQLASSLMESLINPMLEKMEEWKRQMSSMEREHGKESKRVHQELKKTLTEAQKDAKKVKKGYANEKVEKIFSIPNEKLIRLRDMQLNSVKSAMIHERYKLCIFVSCLKPVVDHEISMLSEISHVQEILESLCLLADDPDSLHSSSEQVICDAIGRNINSSTSVIDQMVRSPLPPPPDNQPPLPPFPQISSSTTPQPHLPLQDSPSSELSEESTLSTSTSATQTNVPNAHSSSSSSSPPPPPPPTSATILSYSHLLRSKKSLQSSDDSYATGTSHLIGGCRPHTISSSYERPFTRPVLSSDTYLPLQRNDSINKYNSQYSYPGDTSNSQYAVPCIIPKRRSTQIAGGEKVADIYSRPSLMQSHGGYRTPSIKPLPVATPTVPDLNISPSLPPTGYVNMNQLVMQQHSAHQQNIKDYRESMPEFENLKIWKDQTQDGMLTSSSSMVIGAGNASHDLNKSTLLDTVSNVDLHNLAIRLAKACHLEDTSIDKYCTLPRKPFRNHYHNPPFHHRYRPPSLSSFTGVTNQWSLYTISDAVQTDQTVQSNINMNSSHNNLDTDSHVQTSSDGNDCVQ